MAQNITLMGASYLAVPAVVLPKTGGGTAQFDDTTDADAVAGDITQGKTAYVNGVKLVGTNTGGGGNVKTKTGTFTGDNSTSASISCDFAPDLIYVYGDLSGSASNRGVVTITIVKDTMILHTSDTSTSSTSENITFAAPHGVNGYAFDSEHCRASYSNGTLTITAGANSSANRFTNGITYSYKIVKWTA